MVFNKEKIKELYPEAEDLMIQPMAIHGSTDDQLRKASESGEYMGELKKDGILYQFVKTVNYSYLFSRTVSDKTGLLAEKSSNVPHIINALSCLPPRTIILGEIYYPGGTSKSVTPIMGCLAPKAIERQNGSYGLIHYYIYDILMYDGIDLISNKINNELRYNILEKIFYLHSLDKYDFLELAEVWYDNLYERIGDALAAGEEGMVLKKKNGIYEPGKRPMANLKAKKVDFADVVIIGFESPTTEYYGKEIENWEYWWNPYLGTPYPIGLHYQDKLNSKEDDYIAVTKPYYMRWNNARIKIGAYDNEGKLVNIGTIHSGISDEMKQDMSENPEKYLNKVCAIQCMEKDSKEHTIRHGFYKYMREDKNAEECRLANVF